MSLSIGNVPVESLRYSLANNVPMYGVKFDDILSPGVRLYDAENLNWTPSTASVAGTDDFATLAPFNVRECITKYNSSTGQNIVLAHKGDSNWSSLVSAKTGKRMIEFPKFWYCRPSRYEFIVAPDYIPGFRPSPWHYRNGVMRDVRRITKYNIDTSYGSQTGNTVQTSQTMDTFRSKLKSKGMYLMDFDAYFSIILLMLVKYASFDVQSAVGIGVTSSSAKAVNGLAGSVLGLDGSPTSKTTSESVLTFGIENLFGNVYKFLDGIFWGTNGLYTKPVESMSANPTDDSTLASDYNLLMTNTVDTNGKIGGFIYDADKDYLLFPSSILGGGLDYFSMSKSVRLVLVGGYWYNGSSAGLFYLDSGSVSNSSSFYGAVGIDI